MHKKKLEPITVFEAKAALYGIRSDVFMHPVEIAKRFHVDQARVQSFLNYIQRPEFSSVVSDRVDGYRRLIPRKELDGIFEGMDDNDHFRLAGGYARLRRMRLGGTQKPSQNQSSNDTQAQDNHHAHESIKTSLFELHFYIHPDVKKSILNFIENLCQHPDDTRS